MRNKSAKKTTPTTQTQTKTRMSLQLCEVMCLCMCAVAGSRLSRMCARLKEAHTHTHRPHNNNQPNPQTPTHLLHFESLLVALAAARRRRLELLLIDFHVGGRRNFDSDAKRTNGEAALGRRLAKRYKSNGHKEQIADDARPSRSQTKMKMHNAGVTHTFKHICARRAVCELKLFVRICCCGPNITIS